MEVYAFKAPAYLIELLDHYAALERVTRSDLIREAIKEKLMKLEKKYAKHKWQVKRVRVW